MKSKEKGNKDWTLKIFALLLAIFLWGYVINDVNPEETRRYSNIELEFSNMESLAREGLEIMDPKEAKISVEVLGKKSDMANFSFKSIKAIVDLSGYTEGEKKVPVKVSLDHMSNIKIIDYEPKEVMITFDKLITKERNVTIRTVGELADSYVLGEVTTKIETILLKGPRSWINEVSDVVAYVDLNGRTKSSNVISQIRLLNEDGNDVVGVENEPASIDVNIPILRSKEVEVNIVTDKELPDEYEVKQIVVNPSKVKLKGDNSVLDLENISTKIISMDELLEKDEVKVKLDLPEGIEILDSQEEITISLIVVEAIEKTLDYDSSELEVRNLDNSLETLYDKEIPIKVTIRGDKEKLDLIKKENISIYIDLKDLNKGNNNLQIQLEGLSDMTLKDILPNQINVELKEK